MSKGGKGGAQGGARGAKTAFTVIIIAIIALAAFLCYTYFSTHAVSGSAEVCVIDRGKIYDGVTCLGVELSGTSREEAAAKLEEAAAQATDDINITFNVAGDDITLKAGDFGAYVDAEALAEQAYACGRTGNIRERMDAVNTAAASGSDISYAVTYSAEDLDKAIRAKTADLSLEAKDAQIETEKLSDEEKLTTDLVVNIIPEERGIKVDYDTLEADMAARIADIAALKANETITANTDVTEPTVTAEQLSEQYTKCGTFSTTFSDSASGRRYNIWKMSSIINGVVIEPGETWSINEEAGPRTSGNGWKDAPGISEGQYKQEPGGGICQVSTTLYNTVLRSEVEVVDRKGHSWPATYVPEGLDATISTGGPDFKIKNNYDTPIILAAKCDAEDERTVEVSIYRPAMDYTLDFYSEVIERTYTGGVNLYPDDTLAPGTQVQIIQEHPKVVAEVYKQKFDLDGNQIGEDELYYTDVYSARPAIVHVGPEDPAAAAAAAAAQPAA